VPCSALNLHFLTPTQTRNAALEAALSRSRARETQVQAELPVPHEMAQPGAAGGRDAAACGSEGGMPQGRKQASSGAVCVADHSDAGLCLSWHEHAFEDAKTAADNSNGPPLPRHQQACGAVSNADSDGDWDSDDDVPLPR
jgi:hypothetical protein